MPLRLGSLLVAAVPLALLVIFAVVRDVPPTYDCGDAQTPEALVDAYRAGLVPLLLVGEALTLAVLMAALRADTAQARWSSRTARVLVALGFGFLGAWRFADGEGGGATGAAGAAALAAALAVAVLTLLAGRRPRLEGVAATGLLAAALAIPAWFAAFIAYAVPQAVLVLVGPAAVAGLALMWHRDARPAHLALFAACVAVFVLPLGGVAVLRAGDGPLFC